ncbi:helix-turn-helix transcriptional regulator [Alcanivorax sp.]|uniref:helix-turn-helix domain-containing protein n=1 Tax=Alcanivorax sp. TaxID=1872427 RepID=UPI002605313A|nr:helix-turn-helix transcriptional regulator [Alcanivorax sp.]
MSSDQTTFSAVLGVVLANLRKMKGIEQGEMASKMGVSQASYSRLESGKSSFSVDQLYLAAQALEIDGAELTQRLNKAVQQLNVNGVPVIAPLRGNATKANESGVDPGSMLMGAGLAALLIGMLTK